MRAPKISGNRIHCQIPINFINGQKADPNVCGRWRRMSLKVATPICLTVIFTLLLLLAGSFSRKSGLVVSSSHYINSQMNYQVILLIIAVFSLLATYQLNESVFLEYFSFGKIISPGNELKIFGIKQGDSWLKTGLSLCVVITSVTALFMFFQLKRFSVDWSVLRSGIFWILLFSLTNSFSEEMIYRIGLISPLKGLLAPESIFLISAIIFGLAHAKGVPNGILGMSLAGVLGYVLAKSVFETQGFFWAWIIHFLQDIVIIGSVSLMSGAKGT
jgi:membrane protease YdiL (CAAX protease family)